MTDGLDSSPAWAATPRSARKVYTVIVDRIAASGGDSAEVSHLSFMQDHHCGAPTPSLRLLRYLGLIEIETGARLINRYTLSDRWRTVSTDEAEKLLALAREVKSAGSQAAIWQRMAQRMRPE